jgi:hypothetical protein
MLSDDRVSRSPEPAIRCALRRKWIVEFRQSRWLRPVFSAVFAVDDEPDAVDRIDTRSFFDGFATQLPLPARGDLGGTKVNTGR